MNAHSKLLIAEIGSVHDGSFGNAGKLVDAAIKAGAGGVKFQMHIADAESLAKAPSPEYFKSESRMDYFNRTAFNILQWRELKMRCEDNGAIFLCSPFSIEAVDVLENLGMGIYKIPSGEVTNLPLHERIAQTGKPVLVSSGMSTWSELDAVVEIYQTKGCPVTVMQCSSLYPCPPEKVGLNVMLEMAQRYGVPVGFSDHSMGMAAPLAAAALGATIIEKHFAFSRLMYGSDAVHSMEPPEFLQLANNLSQVWQMLSHPVDKAKVNDYSQMKMVFEKSVVSAYALPAGTVLEYNHFTFKKPGDGIPAFHYRNLLGKRLIRAVDANTQLTWDSVETAQ